MNKQKAKAIREFQLPQIDIPDQYDKFFHCARRIKARYWLIMLAALFFVSIALLPHYLLSSLWKGLMAQKLPVAMLLIFGLLAMSLAWSTGQKIDVWVFMHFNMRGQRPKWLDKSMLGFTQLGNGGVAMGFALVFFIGSNHMLAYELVLGTITLWMIVSFIKAVIRRARPYIQMHGIRIVGLREKGASFPSGHTSQAFFLATLMLHYFKADFILTITLYISALLVGITRIYVGMHYPRDVFAGAILGTAWSLIAVTVNAALFG